MSDNFNLIMRVDAHDDASPVIKAIIAKLKFLKSQVKNYFSLPYKNFKAGLDNLAVFAAKQKAVATSAAKAQADATRDLNNRIALETSMAKKLAREEAAANRTQRVADADAASALKSRMQFGCVDLSQRRACKSCLHVIILEVLQRERRCIFLQLHKDLFLGCI